MKASSDLRATRIITGCDQWARAAHHSTGVDGTNGSVGLSWTVTDIGGPTTVTAAPSVGLAFDRFCRAYRLTSDNVERTRLGSTGRGVDYAKVHPATEFFAMHSRRDATSVFNAASSTSPLLEPAGIGVDDDDRLFIGERGRRQIVVIDLWSGRVVRRIALHSALRDLAVDGDVAWVVTDDHRLMRVSAHSEPRFKALPTPSSPLPPDAQPACITVVQQQAIVLYRLTDGTGLLVAEGMEGEAVAEITDLTTDGTGAVVVAPVAGVRALRRYAIVGDRWDEIEPLDAAGYDGGGIARTSEGRIAYTSARGLRLAVRGRVRYAASGRVVCYRLDSGHYGTRWGRLFLEAHVPTGSRVTYAIRTTDDDDIAAIDRTGADPAGCDPYRPERSPTMPPPRLDVPEAAVQGQIITRSGEPVPWWRRRADDCFQTYEGFADATPGRYAYITLRLTGNGRSTPRLREVRLEAESHRMLDHLPRLYSADPVQESFLHRYLGLLDGTLTDLDVRAVWRDLLVDPRSTPQEALGWLASFVGMVLDERWPVPARRQLVAEANTLYRFRGTLGALGRYLELYLGVRPIIVEHYRMRGLGGAYLQTGETVFDPEVHSRSVLGFGLRVGEAVGDAEVPADLAANSFAGTAHRFSVMIPRLLSEVEEAVVRFVLDRERPAHTAYELCTVDAGMRIGRSLHLGLSSVVGRTGGFEPAVLGSTWLDGDNVLGRAEPGAVVSTARAGSARVG